MSNPIILPSFAAGELAPSMYGRVDLAKYHVGAALLRNYFVDYRGGASSRTGTRFVGIVADSSTPNRLIPFQFNTQQTYALVFGNMTLRFVTNGGYVLDGSGNIYEIATPYAAADLALIKFTQSADVMTFTHTSYAPQTLTRHANDNWTMAPITFQPSTPVVTGLIVTNNGVGDQYTGTYYGYQVTAVVNGVEGLPATVATLGIAALGQNVGAQNTVGWNAVTSATIYNIYRTQENLSSFVPEGALYGYIGSTNPATVNTFIDDNILPDFTNCPPQGNNPFTKAGNPGCVCYYQQRQVFGGMANAPEQMDFSKSGDFFNMGFSIPSKDDDNIEITIASQQVNAIEFMLPLNNLLVLTSSGAWSVNGGAVGATLTPQQVQATPQAYNGCSSICPPIAINYDILYVQARGSIVRDLSYNFYVNLYTGTDITMMSNHLFFGYQLLEWAYAEEPFKIVWAVRNDGIMLSLTYVKEQEVMAWAHHDTQGLFKSVCSVVEGQEDVLYVIVERFIQGQYLQYIERFASRQFGGDPTIGLPADASRAWCVDSGLEYPLNEPNATLTPVATDSIPIIYGVNVIAGGQNYSSSTVLEVTDSTGSGGLLVPVITGGVITAVSIVSAGTGWTNPTITVFDPTGAGSGAALQTQLASPVTMNASAAVFGSTKVGDVVRVNGGLGYVLSVPSSTQIVVNVVTMLSNTWPSVAGNWSVTTPVQTVSGLDHLNGETVSILADGSVAPSQVVVDGSITLDRMYSSIIVGLPFTCQLQSLYIDVQEQGGTIQSKRKTIPFVTVRLQDSRGIYAGYDFDHLIPIKERTNEAMGQPIELFTGDQRVSIPANYNVKGQVCIQVTDPLPSTILALIPELQIGDN